MEEFNNHALKKIYVYYSRYNFISGISIYRSLFLFHGNNNHYMNFAILSHLNSRKRRFHGLTNSYYNKFVSQIKNEIRNDKLLQNDIKFLKKKFDNLYCKIYDNSSLKNFFFSNNFFYVAILHKINKLLSNLKFFIEKISLIFFRLFTSDFFSEFLTIVKNVFNDETSRNKVERELLNWKFDRNKDNFTSKININKKIRNINDTNNMKVHKIESSIVAYNYSLKDKFSSKIKDIPLLKNIFENKHIETMFNINKISRAIKEMKFIDPNFKLNDFISIFEFYILPKFMESYHEYDEHKLRLHCGDKAYKQFYSNMIELKKTNLRFITKILQLGDIELKGAEISEVKFSYKDIKIQKKQPVLIFTFKAQQINCLQDHNGRIISGSFDDIREFQYFITVTPHPDTSIGSLEYPYLITELATMDSTPTY